MFGLISIHASSKLWVMCAMLNPYNDVPQMEIWSWTRLCRQARAFQQWDKIFQVLRIFQTVFLSIPCKSFYLFPKYSSVCLCSFIHHRFYLCLFWNGLRCDSDAQPGFLIVRADDDDMRLHWVDATAACESRGNVEGVRLCKRCQEDINDIPEFT